MNPLTRAAIHIVENHGASPDENWQLLQNANPALAAYLQGLQMLEWLAIDKEIVAIKETAIERYKKAKSQAKNNQSEHHDRVRACLQIVVEAASKGEDVSRVCWRDLEILAESAPDMREQIERVLETSERAAKLASPGENAQGAKARMRAWQPFLSRDAIGYPRDRLDRELWEVARQRAKRDAHRAEPLGAVCFNTPSRHPAVIAWLLAWQGPPPAAAAAEQAIEDILAEDAAGMLDEEGGAGEGGAAAAVAVAAPEPPPALRPF